MHRYLRVGARNDVYLTLLELFLEDWALLDDDVDLAVTITCRMLPHEWDVLLLRLDKCLEISVDLPALGLV